jgi:5-methylthioadenosine/S-adenosylhomocysteine deaminase
MYLAALLPRDASLNPAATVPEDAVEMATIEGARAFGWETEIGSLEVGKKADITLFDTRNVNWRPLHNPVNNLVYAATGDSVDTVLVDGRVLMQGRRILAFDEDEVREKVEALNARMFERLGLKVRSRWPVID